MNDATEQGMASDSFQPMYANTIEPYIEVDIYIYISTTYLSILWIHAGNVNARYKVHRGRSIRIIVTTINGQAVYTVFMD